MPYVTYYGAAQTMGFILLDYWGYIAHIESCVCYCELGDYEKASWHKEPAAGYHPGSAAVQHNPSVFGN